MNQEEIVAAITERILKILEQREQSVSGTEELPEEKKPKVLVLGGACPPEVDAHESCLYTQEQYNGNISEFDRVVIAKLDFCDLTDIALGRNGSALSDVVIRALIGGVEVQMLESALPHRQLSGATYSLLYRKLEEYTGTLLAYGVKLIGTKTTLIRSMETILSRQTVSQKSTRWKENRLITEESARKLAAKSGSIRVQKGTILTPSARDVFADARIEIITE